MNFFSFISEYFFSLKAAIVIWSLFGICIVLMFLNRSTLFSNNSNPLGVWRMILTIITSILLIIGFWQGIFGTIIYSSYSY